MTRRRKMIGARTIEPEVQDGQTHDEEVEEGRQHPD